MNSFAFCAALASALALSAAPCLCAQTGRADETGTVARFVNPYGVAVDGAGNVYLADTQASTIRKITSSGVETTLAGTAGVSGSADGTGSAGRFYFPTDVAVDAAGNLYVADTGNFTIRKITSGGVVTTLAGMAGMSGSADGTGSAARFLGIPGPFGVAVDGKGNVYVADSYSDTIRKITPGGVVTTLAGTAGVSGSADGTGSAARFYYPFGVAADRAGNVYVADSYNHTIRKITSRGVVTTLAGVAGKQGSADGTGSAARFCLPSGVAVDEAGNVYVADTDNDTIRKVTPGGVVTTLAGAAGVEGSTDGRSSAARFIYPFGVAVDRTGTVYVADFFNDLIRKISAGGTVTTLTVAAKPSRLWAHDNLLAWAVHLYDAKHRTPEETASMLDRLGIKNFAYEWHPPDVTTFDAWIDALKRHKINVLAWELYASQDCDIKAMLETFKRHQIHPQLWYTENNSYLPKNSEEQQQRVMQEANRFYRFVKLASPYGCNVELYNHGEAGWLGLINNQLAVLDRLKEMGITSVGIVYNFGHARDDIHDDSKGFGELWNKMKPHVVVVNITGIDGEDRFLYPSQGHSELKMMRIIQESGWTGTVGVIAESGGDAEVTLTHALAGLDWLAAELTQPGSGGPRPFPQVR